MAAATEPLLVPGGRRAGSWSALSGSGRQKGRSAVPRRANTRETCLRVSVNSQEAGVKSHQDPRYSFGETLTCVSVTETQNPTRRRASRTSLSVTLPGRGGRRASHGLTVRTVPDNRVGAKPRERAWWAALLVPECSSRARGTLSCERSLVFFLSTNLSAEKQWNV